LTALVIRSDLPASEHGCVLELRRDTADREFRGRAQVICMALKPGSGTWFP
jgi:hypothetical protein